jgi:septal ring factor EnvC (AmiA/AmiB activator)
VAKINPLFITHNSEGEIEGVRYDRLSVVFVNAFKQQQAQIRSQVAQIQSQSAEIDLQKTRIESLQSQFERQQKQLEQLQRAIGVERVVANSAD